MTIGRPIKQSVDSKKEEAYSGKMESKKEKATGRYSLQTLQFMVEA